MHFSYHIADLVDLTNTGHSQSAFGNSVNPVVMGDTHGAGVSGYPAINGQPQHDERGWDSMFFKSFS